MTTSKTDVQTVLEYLDKIIAYNNAAIYGYLRPENNDHRLVTIQHAELAKAAAQRLVDGWLPIDSAPKDGSEILLLSKPSVDLPADYAVAYWCNEDGEWYWNKPKRFILPTHWQPLPTPPTTSEEA